MPLPKDLTLTTEGDLRAMVLARESEGAYLDLKRDIPTRDARGQQDLIADVSAFANSAGGDIIYGINEDGEGRAESVVPQLGNMDEEARRVQDVLMNNIEPRVPGLQVVSVPVVGGFVLVVRVPQSWVGPHRVKTNNAFYVRENGRKRPLDVPEIRGLFLRSNQQAQQVRDFRTNRLGAILAGAGPHRLLPGSVLVIHLIPTQAALGNASIDPVPYMKERRLPILGAGPMNARVNADGAIAVRTSPRESAYGYSQFFRNAYFEAVKVLKDCGDELTPLGSVTFEGEVIELVKALRAEYLALGIGAEMTCMFSILRADRVELSLRNQDVYFESHQGRFDRQTLTVPDVVLLADASEACALRPVFDLVWQSAGIARSLNYDHVGDWSPSPPY